MPVFVDYSLLLGMVMVGRSHQLQETPSSSSENVRLTGTNTPSQSHCVATKNDFFALLII